MLVRTGRSRESENMVPQIFCVTTIVLGTVSLYFMIPVI